MARRLIIASIAWVFAGLAAIAGALVPHSQLRLSLGLFAFAVLLGLVVAILLLASLLRRRSRRRGGRARGAESPLRRLEYLPAVTTRTRLLQWRGGRYVVSRRPAPDAAPAAQDVTLAGGAQPLRGGVQGVTGSTYPLPASSTRQPQTDAAEAGHRGS